ncbi:hypothetical protein FYK55_24020 [Roseiconus nitratireducens]|uniref:DUF997 family protein n=1 Tax=Roseiconus nitratireducens TaxID=2605748 RepID=A0A5M6CVY7_9BACT|nr:YhdT family protein [Roseiconus nitratireducens]KAA5539408.1 hypothetical protein FYK55_24020 [Roseiconus nitratireducens]
MEASEDHQSKPPADQSPADQSPADQSPADRPPMETTGSLLRHARREGIGMLVIWAVCFLWVVGYCGTQGYHNEGAATAIRWGMPAWVLWGVFLPWGFATVASCIYALVLIADDPLDDPLEEAAATDRRSETLRQGESDDA